MVENCRLFLSSLRISVLQDGLQFSLSKKSTRIAPSITLYKRNTNSTAILVVS